MKCTAQAITVVNCLIDLTGIVGLVGVVRIGWASSNSFANSAAGLVGLLGRVDRVCYLFWNVSDDARLAFEDDWPNYKTIEKFK